MMVAVLIAFIIQEKKYKCTFGDAYRDPRVKFPYGSPKSLHKSRLAIDLNIFKENKLLVQGCDEYEEIGAYWEGIGGTWGGRFSDSNHFSLEHEGKK